MTIRYNWKSMKQHTKMDFKKIVEYFKIIHLGEKDFNKYLIENEYARKILKSEQVPGLSFIENLTGFLSNNMNASKEEMFVYLDLVSRRDYFTYLNTKKKVRYLPIWKIEGDYDIEKLKSNRLLYIDEQNIYFVYEEGEL